jgi:hypothetical protein
MPNAECLCLAFALVPSLAHAQGAAPSMYNIKEIIVQYAHFSDPKSADACGLVREDIAALLDKALHGDSVPAIPVASANPPMIGSARIELVPEIASMGDQGLDCTSWVSLTAQSQSNVRIAPVDTPRSVTVVYWHQGTMVASGQPVHEHAVGEVLEKMAHKFAQQYRIDQPPELPKP